MTHALPRFAGAAAATLAALCAAGAWPTYRMAGDDGLRSMGVAVGIVLVGAVLGFLPMARASGAEIEDRVQFALIGMGIRMMASLAGVAIVYFADLAPHRQAFLAWSVIGYLGLLVLETVVLARLGRSASGNGAASA